MAQQIRIRLRSAERQRLESVQLQNLKEGHPQAVTLSSWVRHQIEPLLGGNRTGYPCCVSKETYRKVKELARLLNKTPEVVIEECVAGIDNLIHHTDSKRPLIVAEWRLRRQYLQLQKEGV